MNDFVAVGIVVFISVVIFLPLVYYVIIKIEKSNFNKRNDAYAMYVKGTINFFDNYLLLCKNHSVNGTCKLNYLGSRIIPMLNNEVMEERRTKIKCIITSVDDKRASEMISEVKKYLESQSWHYVFTDVNANGQVIMVCSHSLLCKGANLSMNHAWKLTFRYIKRELKRKWPNANITFNKAGIIVKS